MCGHFPHCVCLVPCSHSAVHSWGWGGIGPSADYRRGPSKHKELNTGNCIHASSAVCLEGMRLVEGRGFPGGTPVLGGLMPMVRGGVVPVGVITVCGAPDCSVYTDWGGPEYVQC